MYTRKTRNIWAKPTATLKQDIRNTLLTSQYSQVFKGN
jgi:hypothetical protein